MILMLGAPLLTIFALPLFDCNLPRGEISLFGLTWLARVKLGVTGEVTPFPSDALLSSAAITIPFSSSTGLSCSFLLPQKMESRGLGFTFCLFNLPILGGLSISSCTD
jgi:hypothetical protein